MSKVVSDQFILVKKPSSVVKATGEYDTDIMLVYDSKDERDKALAGIKVVTEKVVYESP